MFYVRLLINVQILEGESALKEGSNLECEKCNFFGMYPLWHITGGNIHDCHFDTRARAGIWYSQNFEVSNCQIDAPKMFRKLKDFKISNCNFTNAEETLWCCDNIELFKVKAINGNNFALDSHNFKVVELNLVSKYVFQNCSNITINGVETERRSYKGLKLLKLGAMPCKLKLYQNLYLL